MTLPVLAAERVGLRALTEGEASYLARWFSDEEFQRHQWGAWHGPMSLKEAQGFWARFQAAGASPGGPAFYQWQVDGNDIPGATRASYYTPVLKLGDGGHAYRAVISAGGAQAFNSLYSFVE